MARILIIDDEEYIRDILSVRAQRLNHTVTTASTVQQGKELIKKTPFDLIFLDIILPDGNGLDLMKLLLQLPSKPKVIVISGSAHPENIKAAKGQGAWDFLSKPLKKEDIIQKINLALA